MKTILRQYTVQELCKGFVYNQVEGKGLFGLSGKLTIQPEYQRNYIYADGKRDVAVIESILNMGNSASQASDALLQNALL